MAFFFAVKNTQENCLNAHFGASGLLKCGSISAEQLESAFYCKPKPSGVSLESPKIQNISQVLGNRAKVVQNHDAREAVSLLSQSSSEVGLHFGPGPRKGAFKKVCCVHFTASEGHQELI